MLDVAPSPVALDPKLDRVFSTIVFDWDGTAVPDRQAETSRLGAAMDRLLSAGAHLAVITGTRFGHIDQALAGHIRGPHAARLLVSTNRGSELYGYDASGEPLLLARRLGSPDEERALDVAAERIAGGVRSATGLDVIVVRDRLNRRKIDLFPSWSDPPKARLGELVAAVEARLASAGWRGGVAEVVRRALSDGEAAGVPDPRVSSDGKHVEIGLTDKTHAIEMVLAWLAEPPDGLLIVGDEVGTVGGVEGSDARLRTPWTEGALFVSVGPEPAGVPAGVLHLGGGPGRFVELLEAQADRRARVGADASAGPAPPVAPTEDPARELVDIGLQLVREHEVESRFTVGNGAVGIRGSLSEGTPLSSPATRLAGAWVPGTGGIPMVALAPEWTNLRVRAGEDTLALEDDEPDHRRVLDMAQGIYWRTWQHEGGDGRITQLRVARFASMADRRVLAERVEITSLNWSGDLEIEARVVTPPYWWRTGPATWVGPAQAAMALELRCEGPSIDEAQGDTTSSAAIPSLESESPSVVARWRVVTRPGMVWRFDRIDALARGAALPPESLAQATLATGLDRAAYEHSLACRTRVDALTVTLEGDFPLQQALAFATHHLVAAANPEDEHVSIGARALTGPVYMGHVFWDTELWLQPVYVLTWPRAARALSMYRWHTLPAARDRARQMGYRGALYAWESADTGADVTPPLVVLPDGLVSPVLSGAMEHHISADVAWAAWHYWTWTGDDTYLQQAGAEVILETARFWASRGAMGPDGRFHIRHVIGPDEYHEDVDDNAYTNGMAAWNLQRGAEVARVLAKRWPGRWRALMTELDLTPEEIATWEPLAAAMHIGFDPSTGLIEQFTGYFGLEDIDLRPHEPRTLPVDVLLGSPRVRGSQLIKQADVVLLLQLLGDRFPPDVHEANFRYYEPRTAHGSSLSPPIYALAAARLGDFATADRYLRQTAAIDLLDGNAAGGIHIGALGGLWQAFVFGYGGLEIGADGPTLSPRLPPWLRRLSFRLTWRERRYRAEVDMAGGRLVPEGPW
ncbi:MAG: glycoside hydrolase family 65 [Pseudomonadota bacterium]|nr:glycoside hydrolase family 65 [Pseudomonadota bacterium]